MSPDFRSLLHDSCRFIRRFRNIIEENPPQSYFVGILFAPSNSQVRLNCQASVPSWLNCTNETETGWDALLQTLGNHTANINDIAFSPDGSSVATAASDGTLRIYATDTGLQNFEATTTSQLKVKRVAFSPDGSRFAAESDHCCIRLWRLETDTAPQEIRCQYTRGGILEFSPDGKLLAFAAFRNEIGLWDIEAGCKLRQLKGNSQALCAVSFSKSGRLLASMAEDTSIRIWDRNTGMMYRVFAHKERPKLVQWSSDGNHIATATIDGSVHLWDVPKGTCTLIHSQNFRRSKAARIAFSPRGDILAYTNNHDIVLWNVSTQSIDGTIRGHPAQPISNIVFSPDGSLLASTAKNAFTIKLWETSNISTPYNILDTRSREVQTLVFSRFGDKIASTHLVRKSDFPVSLWQTIRDPETTIMQENDIPRELFISKSGNKLVCQTNRDRNVTICERNESGAWADSMVFNCVTRVEFSQDESLVVLFRRQTADDNIEMHDLNDRDSLSDVWHLEIWDTCTGARLSQFQETGKVAALCFSPDNSFLAFAFCGYQPQQPGTRVPLTSVAKISTTGGDHLEFSRKLEKTVTSIAFSPDCKHLAAVLVPDTLNLWDVTTRLLRFSEKHHSIKKRHLFERYFLNPFKPTIEVITFSPDSNIVASSVYDLNIGRSRIWLRNSYSGQLIRILGPGIDSPGYSISFSANGSLLAVKGIATVAIWDLQTRTLIQESETNGGANSLVFDRNNSSIHTECETVPIYQSTLVNQCIQPRSAALKIKDNWITWNGVSIIRLPREYNNLRYAQYGAYIVIGVDKGRFIHLSVNIFS